MIARVIFDGINVSDKVMRRGIKSLTGMTFDEDGLQAMGEATIQFSDLDGFFRDYARSTESVEVAIDVDHYPVFRGVSSQEGITYDPSTEISTCQILPAGANEIEKLKAMSMQDIADAGTNYKREFGITTEQWYAKPVPGTYTLGRYFLSFADIFTVLGEIHKTCAVDLDISGVTPSQYYLGGNPVSADYFRVSELNCWEFIMGVASLFNGIVTYSNGTFSIQAKKDLVDSVATPLDLPLIRGSLQETNKRVGADEVIIRMSGAAKGIRSSDPATSKIVNTTVSKSITKEIPFRCPRITRMPVGGWLPAQIRADSENVDFVVYNPTGSWDALATYAITSQNITPWYLVELKGTTEWKAAYSVMDNAAILPTVMSALPPILFPGAVGTRPGKFLVRESSVDIEEETVEMNVLGYAQ
jgi:hypothetical protein